LFAPYAVHLGIRRRDPAFPTIRRIPVEACKGLWHSGRMPVTDRHPTTEIAAMTTSTQTYSILSATQHRVAALLSLAVTVAMLAANIALVDHYAAPSMQTGSVAATSTPSAGVRAQG
jgi:hypothetical protein